MTLTATATAPPDETRGSTGHAHDNAMIARHRAVWAAKPLLARVYSVWFERILAEIPSGARVLEVGAGPGLFSEYARRRRPDLRWIASDYLEVRGNSLVADALRLPACDSAFGAVVGFDVVHHLVAPACFFREAARVLQAGGRVLLLEPWLSVLSYPLYRLLHHERCRLTIDPWQPFAAQDTRSKETFEGDAAVPWKMIRVARPELWHEMGLCPPQVEVLNGLAYLASLGFYLPSLWPRRSSGSTLIRLDRWLRPLSPWIGLRALLHWRRAQ